MRNNKLMIIWLLIGGIFCTGCDYPVAKPDGSVPDQSKITNINYENYWQYLSMGNGTKFEEISFDIDHKVETPYLKTCGGPKAKGYLLLDENDQTIASKADLLKEIEKIKTPEEAVAWLYATTCNLKNQFDDQRQFVNLASDGYLVGTIFYNWYGCGNHANRLNLYLVDFDGRVKLINSDQLEFGKEFCGD